MLRKAQCKEYRAFSFKTVKDNEGVVTKFYEAKSNPARDVDTYLCEIWPASGQTMAQMYGQELKYVLNMNTDYLNELDEGDALMVESDHEPDFYIDSKLKYSRHIKYVLKKVRK